MVKAARPPITFNEEEDRRQARRIFLFCAVVVCLFLAVALILRG